MTEEPWSAEGLHGTLMQPTGMPGRKPAVLIIAGSGPTDRDGNGPAIATDTYKMIAQGFAAQGISSLRYDKRGIGKSHALLTREDDSRFGDFVSDAVMAAQSLAGRANVSKVFLAGHSEGALIALLVAQRIDVAGVILLAAPGRPLATVLREQLQAALPPQLQERTLRILNRLTAGETVPDLPAELRTLFRPSVQPFLMSILNVDPAAELAKLKVPVMAVHAARDLQIASADIDALRQARPDMPVVMLPEANHILKVVPADRDGNIAMYTNRAAPLDAGLMTALVEFVRGVAR